MMYRYRGILSVYFLFFGQMFTSDEVQSATIWSCDFDQNSAAPCNMTQSQDDTDGFDWLPLKGPTASADTGPSSDHTSGLGYYMYIEISDHNPNDYADLDTPSLADSKAYCLTFWYHMYGYQIGSLSVIAVTSSGDAQEVWLRKKESTDRGVNDWQEGNVTLQGTTQKARFRAVQGGSGPGQPHGDIAIDDVVVENKACGAPDVTTPSPTTEQLTPKGPTTTQSMSTATNHSTTGVFLQWCPANCKCDEKNQCQKCQLWYVPYGACGIFLKPASLPNEMDPILQVVSETTVTIRFLQNQHDIPLGYDSHYVYRLLIKHTDSFEILLTSSLVYHDSSQEFVDLTATGLRPATSYTFKAAIYRSHRGEVEKGTTDSEEITLTTLPYASEPSLTMISSTEDSGTDQALHNGNTGQDKSDQTTLALAVFFGVLFAIAMGAIIVSLIRRYHHKRHKSTQRGATTASAQEQTRTYENMTVLSTEYSEINPAGNIQDTNYTSLESQGRSIPHSDPYTFLQ